MEILSFSYRGTVVPIAFSRKRMRSVRLRVSPSGEVSLSAPFGFPEAEVRAFLEKHAAWLYRKWSEKKNRTNYMDIPFLSESGETFFLGEKRRVVVLPRGEGGEPMGEKDFVVRTKAKDPTVLARLTERKLRACAEEVFFSLIERLMPLFEPWGVKRPALEIRKMRAKWGCCKCEEGIVVLNLHLIKASLDCVEYVVMHELAHFLYRGHGADFRAFMTRVMPDWRARKRRLNEGLPAREA